MSVESTRLAISKYLKGHSIDVVTDNAVFTVTGSGKSYKGHKEIDGLLEYFYHQAFDAKAETKKMIVSDGAVVLEADFVGRHKGEFAGMTATGKNVRVPMCISYELQNNRITSAHIYFEVDSFLRQAGKN